MHSRSRALPGSLQTALPLVLAVLVALLVTRSLGGAEGLSYTLAFADPRTHVVEVTAVVPTDGRGEVELFMATWTPGSYLVREYARYIENVTVTSPDGAALDAVKVSKNRWKVASAGHERVTVRYRLHCRELGVQSNWVDAELAMLNGAPTFITRSDALDRPHEVRLELPPSWRQSVTPLARVETGGPHHFRAPNYHVLVDSPILAGNPAVFPFEAGGASHLLVNLGDDAFWDGAAAARDVERVVVATQELWGDVPYERYIFMTDIAESGGGLEHDESTLMLTSRWTYRSRKSYLGWLGLVSHEFFHTWNVRRLRPRALSALDYESERYTPSLWIAEGITSYYDDLLVHRAGLSTRAEYLERLSRSIERLQKAPGRLVQSLSASSHDTWIKFYRPHANSQNVTISYYTKGAVVAFLLDARIQRATAGKRSLDDVMRALWKKHSGDRGYSPEDFRRVTTSIAGTDLTPFFAAAVDAPGELDYAPALEWFGLEFKKATPETRDTDGEKDPEAGDETPGDPKKPKAWVGAVTRDSGGRLLVSRVPANTPAFAAGLDAGDEILAIDRYRVLPDGLERRLEQYRPGDRVTLLVSRRGELLELGVTLGEAPRETWKLALSAKASDEQKKRVDAWLGPERAKAAKPPAGAPVSGDRSGR